MYISSQSRLFPPLTQPQPQQRTPYRRLFTPTPPSNPLITLSLSFFHFFVCLFFFFFFFYIYITTYPSHLFLFSPRYPLKNSLSLSLLFRRPKYLSVARSTENMSYYSQQQPPVGVPPPQGYPPEGYPKDAYPPPGYPPQGYPPQGYPPQGYPPQYAPQYAPPPPQQQQGVGGAGCLEGCLAALCCCCLLDACF
ncbi:hypothetical protein ACSBR2_019127 [Camellia fascicularis]